MLIIVVSNGKPGIQKLGVEKRYVHFASEKRIRKAISS